jgi:hypothetical protein
MQQRQRASRALYLFVGALGSLACASDGASSDADGVPPFVGMVGPGPSLPNATDNGAPTATGATEPQQAPASSSSTSGSNEGNVMPSGIEPAGAGGSAAVANDGSGVMATGGIGAGGSAIAAGGSATGASGGAMSASGGNEGSTPASEPAEPDNCPPNALFCDDFEDDVSGQFPSAPWQNNTGSGAVVRVDGVQAFSGQQAVHVNAPPNQPYRRGYFSLEQGSSDIFPAVSRGMFGRAMLWLDATPNAVVHWTIIQAEGRAADGTHDTYYRYGGQQQGGAGIMASYETNSGVSTDCYSHSATRMPVQRWACVEWHFDVGRSEMQLWLDGTELADMHVVDRPTTPGSGCLGNALNGEWLAPPAFTTLHLGWENYQMSSNDRNLWIDDVAIGTERMGCPAP